MYVYIYYIYIYGSRHWIWSWPEGCCSQGQQALVIERSIGDLSVKLWNYWDLRSQTWRPSQNAGFLKPQTLEIDINTYWKCRKWVCPKMEELPQVMPIKSGATRTPTSSKPWVVTYTYAFCLKIGCPQIWWSIILLPTKIRRSGYIPILWQTQVSYCWVSIPLNIRLVVRYKPCFLWVNWLMKGYN